jgi:hypothetical protein
VAKPSEPTEQHGLVAEARHQHTGRNVEEQNTDAAQPHDHRGDCGARAELHDVQRQKDRERLETDRHE